MTKKPNILVIRFSSIGDIILTTPIIRCLKSQINAEIDFLTKSSYKNIIISNPNIREVHTTSESSKTIEALRSRHYDFIIDLQNNFRFQVNNLQLIQLFFQETFYST